MVVPIVLRWNARHEHSKRANHQASHVLPMSFAGCVPVCSQSLTVPRLMTRITRAVTFGSWVDAAAIEHLGALLLRGPAVTDED